MRTEGVLENVLQNPIGSQSFCKTFCRTQAEPFGVLPVLSVPYRSKVGQNP